MNFHRYYLNMLFLAALLVLTGSCSKEDHDDDVNNNGESKMAYTVTKVQEKPAWAVDYSYNDEKPDWSEPNIQFYENWCIIMVRLQDELAAYSSEDDMMAVFINDELRGFARPAVDLGDEDVQHDGVYFIVNVFGNEISSDSVHLFIKYYSAKLHNLFTLEGEDVFEPEKVYGIGGNFIPDFTRGTKKFPIYHPIGFSYTDNPNKGFDIVEGDMLAAFVGDECRMVYHVGKNLLNDIVYTAIHGKEMNEQAEIRYYSSQKNEVYIFKDKVTLQSTNKTAFSATI